MQMLGETLKRAREAKGIPLREMAVRTKISVATLEALERNDFRRIPGGIFGRSFVRAYAIEAGLDPDVTVEQFTEGLAEAEREAAERRRARQPAITLDDRQFLERQRHAYVLLRIALVVGLLALLVAAVWAVRTYWARPQAPVVAAPDAAPSSQPVPAPIAPAEVPVKAGAGAATVVPADEAASRPAAALVVEMDFTADARMTVSIDGRSQPSRLYRSGERAELQAADEVLVDVGDAGAVRLVINGREARPLGAAGVRVRTRITRENVDGFY